MCGFMVYTKKDITKNDFKRDFEKIKYRGPNMTNILETEEGIFGFHRLSIMDLSNNGMQPFELKKNVLVCNGEIYNYKEFKEELKQDGIDFISNSDCEVLLPMFRKYGLKMFKKLDAEFAMVMYDENSNSFIAARDSIGIRPLFYGYSKISHSIMFASEAKALIELCDNICPFPIGSYFYKDKFYKYKDVSRIEKYKDDSLELITKNIHEKLENAVIKRLDSDAPLGFLLSGGLDSSLVCSIASRNTNKPIRTFAIGMDKDAIDLKYARIVADYIKSDHTEVIINKDDVYEALEKVIYCLESWDITTIRASVGMYLLCHWIRENTNIKVLLTGEVSDELFGYKYTDFAPTPLDFQKESLKRVKELYMYDVLRADRCISSASIEARVPFADIDFVKYVLSINPKHKMNKYGIGKYLLRKAFSNNYLPDVILNREKAAFSDAVGHSLVDDLKELAELKYNDEDYIKLRNKYNYRKPFTKESLMYREIFNKYYEGYDKLIKDYWMPNKKWNGCNVNDPSARVLKNYGNSGK